MFSSLSIVAGIAFTFVLGQAAVLPGAAEDSPKNGVAGDVLNITSCYCKSGVNERVGFYLQADYANYHTGKTYSVNQVCSDDNAVINGLVSVCLGKKPFFKEKICDEDEVENRFCFERDWHNHRFSKALHYEDKYFFNDQKRHLDEDHPQLHPAPEECEEYCEKQMGGMEASRLGEDWGILVNVSKRVSVARLSNKVVYTDLDDMCWDCK